MRCSKELASLVHNTAKKENIEKQTWIKKQIIRALSKKYNFESISAIEFLNARNKKAQIAFRIPIWVIDHLSKQKYRKTDFIVLSFLCALKN